MLEIIGIFINFFLIIIIFLRVPQDDGGLGSFATQSNLLGSPRSARRLLNTVTGICILIYLGIALKLNLLNIS